MNDAQTWTLIGGFFALMVAMTGMVHRWPRRDAGPEIASVLRAGSKPGSITWTATSRP